MAKRAGLKRTFLVAKEDLGELDSLTVRKVSLPRCMNGSGDLRKEAGSWEASGGRESNLYSSGIRQAGR